MATNNDKPKFLDEVLQRISSRGDDWLRYVEKHAMVGESWEQADARLRREQDEAKAKQPVQKAQEAMDAQAVQPTSKAIQPTTKRPLARLLPDRAQQQDFFVADIFDAELKDDIASMEHPLFALKAGDKRIKEYKRKGYSVKIMPGAYGCATIYDKDLWIYCISKLVEAKNRKEKISRTVRFTAYDFLKNTNRPTSGLGYQRMAEALRRLSGTRIETNIEIDGYRDSQGFGLVDWWRVVERDIDERMVAVEVDLPRWLFASIDAMQVLTLSRDYFRIRKALDRRIYELARKHCGAQASWTVSIKTLHEKSGSSSTLKEFRRQFRELAKTNDLPDYRIRFDEKADVVTFYDKSRRGYQVELLKLVPDLAGRFGMPKKPKWKSNK